MTDRVWDILEKIKLTDKIEKNFAVLILNQPITADPEFVKLLWNKASYRMLVDGGANEWLSFVHEHGPTNFQNPNAICGDFDSIRVRGRSYFESKGVQFHPTPDQNETDFTKALRHLAAQDHNGNIDFAFAICENSGRLDQILANINTLIRSQQFMSNTDVYLLTRETISWIIKPGVHTIIGTPDCIEGGLICGVIPVCGPAKVTTSGLKWNLDNQTLKMGDFISTSNLFKDLEVRITSNETLIWTTQYCRGK